MSDNSSRPDNFHISTEQKLSDITSRLNEMIANTLVLRSTQGTSTLEMAQYYCPEYLKPLIESEGNEEEIEGEDYKLRSIYNEIQELCKVPPLSTNSPNAGDGAEKSLTTSSQIKEDEDYQLRSIYNDIQELCKIPSLSKNSPNAGDGAEKSLATSSQIEEDGIEISADP